MSTALPLRDPAVVPRLIGVTLALVILWPLLVVGEFRPWALLDERNLRVMSGFLTGFWPPETQTSFLYELGAATVQTLAIATAGIALACVLAVPMALIATQALSLARIGPGSPAEQARSRWLRRPVRLLMMLLRGIPELVWALVFVRLFGLGPTAGVLALGLTYGGMLAKVYAEILESGDQRPARALLEAGSPRLVALFYGLLPGAAQELTSYTVYRWECAVRASVVMGFVGAGGLGQLMDQSMKMLNGGEAVSILICFLLLVLAADALSASLRRALGNAGLHPHASGVGQSAWIFIVVALALVSLSFAHLQIALGDLFSLAALRQAGDFFVSFWPPDLSATWLGKVARGALETLAISLLGTLLAALAGLLLALPAAGNLGRVTERATQFLLNGLRSVPELVWATLMALAAGLGPFAGILALALHTSGVLGRLFAEALQNAPAAPRSALHEGGAPAVVAFAYGTLPEILPQLIAYTLYRWEMNIRMAAILGFVGAGGLGQLLYVELSLFHYAQAGTVIAAMLALSLTVDGLSAVLRRRLGT